MGCDHRPVNREDHSRWIPVNAVAMRSAKPIPRNHCIDGVPGFGVRPGIELATLEGTEDDPGCRAVVDTEADVLPWVTGEGRDKLQRESGTIYRDRAGQ